MIKARHEDNEELALENEHKNHGMIKFAYLDFSVIAIFASSVTKTTTFQVLFRYVLMFSTEY